MRRARALRSAPVLALGLILALAASVIQAATSAKFPSANQASAGGGWTNPNNAHADDGTYATAAPGKFATVSTIYQVVFSTGDVPDGSTITAASVEIQYHVDTTASNPTLGSRLYTTSGMGTSLSAPFSDTTEPTADTVVTYPATTQPTVAQLRSGLWVDVQAIRGNSNNAVNFSLDYVRVTITYTPPVLTTTAGTVTATNGAGPTPSLAVSAPYTNDADGDNSLSWRYRTSPAGAWSGSTNISHGASPYSFTVSGLTCGTAYDIEVTYVDADGVTGTNPQTVTATPTNCTLAGTVTAAQAPGATPSIAVSAPYTRDADGDNTLSYRYRPVSGVYGSATNLGHAASPYSFTISGLTCGASYDVEVTYSDADGVSGTAVQTISGVTVDNCTGAGSPSGTVVACNQIDVSAPFTYDANGNGTTSFERGPAAGGPWTAACTGVAGASPRTCPDTGVLPSSSNYYRVTYADADGVGGTAQSVIGPFDTPACSVLPVTPGVPTAATSSCSQITVSAPFAGDSDGDSTTLVEFATAAGGPFTAAPGCSALTGASPRSCAVSGLAQATAYWFRVDFSDPDGVSGTDPQVVGPQSTFDCRVAPQAPSAAPASCTAVTVSAPFAGDWDGDSRTTVSRGSSSTGPWTAVCSDVAGASPRICSDLGAMESSTYYYQVDFVDADGILGTDPQVAGPVSTPACVAAGTDAGVATGVVTGCHQITVSAPFTGDGDRDGHVAVEFSATNTWPGTTSCAAVGGSSPRGCIVTGLNPSTAYWVRVTYVDPDGVTGTAVQVINGGAPFTTPACAGDGTGPTLLFLSPTRDAIIGGVEKLKVQVYDRDGVPDGNVQWGVDGGPLAATGVSRSTRYNCNTGTQTACKVFEIAFDTAALALANGPHWVTVQAIDTVSSASTVELPFTVNNAGTAGHGSGLQLRRTQGSQLCLDCHNVPSHSSQGTGNKYGNWAVDCLTCHTSHGTRNIYLVREALETPASGSKTVVFQQSDRSGGTNPQKSHLGDYDAAGAPYDDGICETCHTRTSHYRNSTSGGDHTHNRTNRCMTCHQHARSFAASGCNGCHKAPPTVGKHGTHDQVWDSTEGNTATAYDDVASHATATQYGFACAKCHSGTHTNDTHAGTLADPFQVEVAFDATSDPKNPSATFATGTAQAPDQGPDSRYWSWTDGSCGSTYCHSNAAPVNGNNSFKTVTWEQAAALTCASCHNTQARGDSGVATDLSAAHGKHIQSTELETGSYTFACDECHALVVRDNPSSPWLLTATDLADKRKHVAGTHSIDFSGTSSVGNLNQSGGSYGQAPGYTCANTYCHSDGRTTTPPYGSQTSIAWNTTADPECDSCHGGNAAATATTGKGPIATNGHGAHMNQSTYVGSNFMCFRCHQDTVVSTGDRAINTISFHVNATRDVNPSDDTTTAWNGSTCASNYCHSSGQVAAVIQYYTTPAWTSGTLANDCKACHGRHADNAFTPVGGEPNYASNGAGASKANDHKKHVDALTDCGDCHNDTSTSGTAILAGSTRHLDGVRDVAIAAAWDGNGGTKYDNYTPATKTCASVRCHVNAGATPQWGGTVTCLACHGVNAAETNDLGASFWNNGTVATINTTEWTYSGHGKTSGSYDVSTNPAAALPTAPTAGTSECLYCHDADVYHKQSTNPFRLRGASAAGGTTAAYNTATPNAPCLNCHATGSNGVLPAGQTLKNGTIKPDATHDGAKHTAATLGGKFCWDCHDPHGDRPSNTNSGGNNIFMIGRQVRVSQDGTHGYTGATGTERSVEFYAVTPGINSPSPVGRIIESTTAVGSNHLGLCQACHNPTTSTPWTKYWGVTGNDDPDGPGGNAPYKSGVTTGTNHNTLTYCISCHAHKDQFKGKGGGSDCLGCHGGTTQGSRRAVAADFADGTSPAFRSHHVGNGTTNTLRGTLNNFDCVVCHGEGMVISATATSADCPGAAVGTTCTNPTYHANTRFDLRDVDTFASDASNVFVYDKDAVETSAGAAGNWNSGNQLWREWTSGVDEAGGATLPNTAPTFSGLDRFCISCHDADGASQIANFRETTSQTATNPFADTRLGTAGLTNNYDQVLRTAVTDIATRVHVTARTAAGGNVTSTDRDNGYTGGGINRGADGRPDPPEGVFSRHAIRGMSGSVYGSTNGNLDTTTYWNRAKVAWSSISVMGCGDCHTVDGANASNGNAHGSGSEYLLKDASGLATEGNSNTTYVCAQCHLATNYVGGTHLGMSSNSGNCPTDSTAAVGATRVSNDGNVFGYFCGSCHGGGATSKTGATFPTGSTGAGGFGTIHGTSQVFGIASATGNPSRPAYRFTNGNAMRYYNPGDWTTNGTNRSCYTIGTADAWSACTQHTGARGTTIQTSMQRPLNY